MIQISNRIVTANVVDSLLQLLLVLLLYLNFFLYNCAGVNGIDGDGDIMNPANLIAFRDFVLKNTDGLGVHFVMGDGVST